MKTTTILAGLIAATTATTVLAADLRYGGSYPPPAPPYAAVMNWTGLYVGGNVGYRWASTAFSTDPSGFAGGLQAGYNYQINQFVLGLETDFQFAGGSDTFAAYKFSNPWFGSLRGRVGYAMNNILFYGTGGFAYGGLSAEYLGWSDTKALTGWTVGGGIEVGFTPNWSAKAEYLYMSLADASWATIGYNAGLESSIMRFGLNYRF